MERPLAMILILTVDNLKRFTYEQLLKEEETERIYLEPCLDGERYLKNT